VASVARGVELSNLHFRRMMFSDLPLIYQMEQRCHQFPWSEESLADCLRMQYDGWVAEQFVDKAPSPLIMGYAIVMKALDEAHLLNIVIDESAQGQGFGIALLNFVKTKAIEQGASVMLLEVRESNSQAQRLYHKSGFEVIGVRKAYYPIENGREAAMVMKCSLGASL